MSAGGTVGAATTGAITIAVDNDGSTAGTLTTSAAIGNASAAGTITLSGADMALGTTITGSGAVILKPSTASRTIGIAGGAGNFALSTTEIGYLTDGFSSVTIGRADGTGLVTINGVTFTDPVTIQSAGVAGAVTLSGALTTAAANAAITLIAGTGDSGTFTQTAGAGNTIASGSGAITITADTVVLNTSANTITGTGAITLQPATASRPIVIGAAGAASDFALSTTEVAALTNGFSSITIGRSDSSGAVTVSATTFNDPVTIQSPAGSGTVTVNGAITGAGNSSVTLTGGTGATPISLNAGITTAGSTITLNDHVGLGANVTLDTTNAAGSPAGNTITFAGTTNADSAGNNRTLTLNGGYNGNITLTGAVGGSQALQTLTVSNANAVSLPAVTTQSGGISVTANAITLNGNLSTNSTVTAGAVVLTGAMTLGADVTITTDAATTDANITLSGSIDGAHVLTLSAGGGNVTVQAASRFFDGVDDSVTVTSSPSLQFSGAFTIGAWVKTSGLNSTEQSNFVNNEVYPDSGIILGDNGGFSSNIYLRVYPGGSGSCGNGMACFARNLINDGQWHYLVGLFDGSNVKLYLDNVLKDTQTSGAFTNNSAAFNLGAFRGSGGGGNLANVQIFDRALNSTELGQIKDAPASVTSGLVGFWSLMGGTSEADRSGQGNTGTLTNGPTMSSASPSTSILTAGYNTALTSLTVTGNAITINGVKTTGAQSYTGTTTLNGSLISSGGAVTVTGAGTLNNNISIDTTNTGGTAAGANINFSSTINADAAANNRTLTLIGGTGGNITLSGAIGGTQAIQSLTVSSAANATLPAITTRSGGISVTATEYHAGGQSLDR